MKDPAFLFYSSDFLTGTMFLTDEQVGKYIRILCCQHQKGHLSEKDMLKICKSYEEDIFSKFKIDENGLYYNVRLELEIQKRLKYSESRRKNRISNKDMNNICDTYVQHMENENENINKDINIKEVKEKKEVEKTWRNDYSIYLQECKKGYRELIENKKFIEHIQKLQPKLNVLASIEMSFHSYWGTEEGWRNKKAKKSKTINWKSTILKNLKFNNVYN